MAITFFLIKESEQNQYTSMRKYTMRIYTRNDQGYVDRNKYTTTIIDPTKPFPPESFLTIYDYALEGENGNLLWLKCVRKYKGREYPEFSRQELFEKQGDIIWRR